MTKVKINEGEVTQPATPDMVTVTMSTDCASLLRAMMYFIPGGHGLRAARNQPDANFTDGAGGWYSDKVEGRISDREPKPYAGRNEGIAHVARPLRRQRKAYIATVQLLGRATKAGAEGLDELRALCNTELRRFKDMRAAATAGQGQFVSALGLVLAG